jgi:gamma-glutamyltranspeptidase/glutathione hydrolase
MVSTGHPIASTEALRVLMDGGNAMDAALTAAFVLSVVKSYHCGLGGDVFLLFYRARESKVYALNGSGKSPRALRMDDYKNGIPKRGILAASVPGAVDGWIEAANKFASRSLRSLIAPAIRYAEEGFPVFGNLERVVASCAKELGGDEAWRRVYLLEGRMPKTGELLRQRGLARTLEAIAEHGRTVFYEGRIAESIVRCSRDRRGFFEHRDLSEHRSRWEEPIHARYKGLDVYVPAPNSYGLLLLLQLKLLESRDLVASGHNTLESLDLQLEIKERSTRDGDPWIADPERLDRRALDAWIQTYPRSSNAGGAPSNVVAAGGDTTYIAAADQEGNWVSLIQSVHQSFGCGVVVDGTGICLNNRMPGFNLVPGHPNELQAGKRPAHTLSPAMVMKDGKPFLTIGTPGGMGQTQFLAQMICNLFDFGMNVQEAIEAPRWQSESKGRVELEGRFPPDVVESLRGKGYDVKVVAGWEPMMGGAEAIMQDARSGVFMGGADPRRDGYAMGY